MLWTRATARGPVECGVSWALAVVITGTPVAHAGDVAPEAREEARNEAATAEPDTGPPVPEPEPDPEPDPDPDPEPDPEPDSDPGSDSDSDSDSDPDSDSDSDPAPDPDPDPDPAPAPAPTKSSVPDRLPAMQIAGWWTLFGAFALASTAGVFSGLAERQEDKATRLASRFDQETGSQPLYADQQSEYEDTLRKGRVYQNTAIGLGVVAGAVAIAAIALFIVDARRGKRGERARIAPGGLQVRF